MLRRAFILLLAFAVLNQSCAFTGVSFHSLNRRLTEKCADAAHPSLGLAHAPAKFVYAYNALGQRLTATVFSATNATLYTETFAYDSRNRATSKSVSVGSPSSVVSSQLSYAYDAQRNLASVHSNDLTAGIDVTYDYDQLNRLAQAASRDPVDGTRKATNYGYDGVGNLSLVTLPNNVTSLYAYDPLNRLQNLTVDRVGALLASYTYTLDASGHRTSVTELNNRSHAYTYDSLYRLTNETITTGTGDPAIGGTIAYTLDNVGNRLARNSSVPSVPSESHSYDTNDRLTSDTYDANGNTISATDPVTGHTSQVTDVYDFENRLISRNSGAIKLLYDCDGNRVSETIGTQALTFLVDTMNPTGYAQVVEERVNGTLMRTYAYGHALISQTQATLSPAWTTTYYAYDGHGSTRLLTDALGAITDTYAYDAFGVQIASTSANAMPTFNRYRYVGAQHDDDLGLIYLRARYMNPASGRFWSQDSYQGFASDPMSLHKYLYAQADPIGRIDPSGMFTIAESFGITITTGTLARIAVVAVVAVVGRAVVKDYDRVSEEVRDIARRLTRSRKSAIIGETSARVFWAKSHRYWMAEILPELSALGIPKDAWLIVNHAWIRKLMTEGALIIDIGYDADRFANGGERGMYYTMEKGWTFGYWNRVDDPTVLGSLHLPP